MLLSEQETARELNIHRHTLRKHRLSGLIKPVYSHGSGRNVRHVYDVEKVRKIIDKIYNRGVDKLS